MLAAKNVEKFEAKTFVFLRFPQNFSWYFFVTLEQFAEFRNQFFWKLTIAFNQ